MAFEEKKVMRRTDREITDEKLIEEFVASEQILRVAYYDEGDIYIVPVNYGYSCEDKPYSFYFHGAKAGRKYELSKCEQLVGFEIDGKYRLLENEIPCKYSAAFQSVIGTGTLCLVEDTEEKRKGLTCIMKQVSQRADWDFQDKMLETVAVFRIKVNKISCKAK